MAEFNPRRSEQGLWRNYPDRGYQICVSRETSDPEWDAFLKKTPGGHHVQTSLWGRVKSALGWQAVRITAQREGQIAAGAQLLIRKVSLAGAVGSVPKGPVFAEGDPELKECVLDALHRLAVAHRVRYLTVQPPNNGQGLVPLLSARGFRTASLGVTQPTATVLIDLTQDMDAIWANMKQRTRYNMRLGKRRGISVREGTERDLETYYRILEATSQRQAFATFSRDYFHTMWSVLAPHGYLKLFLAEYEGEVVSAQLAVPFGDTVINKLSVWSGAYGKHRPNEVLQSATIEWAKSNGFRYYDLEGIDPAIAQKALREDGLPDSAKQTVASFKLGFGGRVALLPDAYDYVFNPFLRRGFYWGFARVAGSDLVHRVLNYLRTS